MMKLKKGATLLVLLSISVVAYGKAKPTLPHFSFRDWQAYAQYVVDDPRVSVCKNIPAGKACALVNDRIGGVKAQQIGVAFGHDGLFALEAKFPSEEAATVEAALRERYGLPCAEELERPFNVFGHKFERRIRVWCFKEGKATFQSMTDLASVGSFEFAVHDAAHQAAVKDF